MPTYSAFQDAIEHTRDRRTDFFKLVFGTSKIGQSDTKRYVCVAYKGHLDKSFTEKFFEYPAQLDEMCADIEEVSKTLTHVYFCPQLLSAKIRRKEYVVECTALWADLDSCSPTLLLVPASIEVQTSTGRWQALWRLDAPVDPIAAEETCMRIAYFHAAKGADRSGWDLTQLLRVPYTPNYKYGDINTAPMVAVLKTNQSLYRLKDFDKYPMYQGLRFASEPMPLPADLPTEDGMELLQRYRSTINSGVFGLYDLAPEKEEDWSSIQWRLGNLCAEAGMTIEQTFKVVWDAKCNKYKRDGRPPGHLWAEVRKIYLKEAEVHKLVPTPTAIIPELMSEEEMLVVQRRSTFIEKYIEWATKLTDAAPQYHQAGAFIILSALISNSVRLSTSFGTVIPNLWFMLVADTTLTRKTTAMDIAMELLYEINPDALMGTDGSPEGVLSAMKDRGGQASIYLRDEFTGLLEAMAHKDYMAGMAEHFTKLYDGKSLKRLLRKEEIIIKDPIFIIFAGATKKRTLQVLNENHINSGFVPRFIFITAKADPDRVRPVGPPVQIDEESKNVVRKELLDINFNFNSPRLVSNSDGSLAGQVNPRFDVELSELAWHRYNLLEKTLTDAALASGLVHLTPVYDRLAKSTLKAAILIAASKQGETSVVNVELEDILHAIYYCRHWHTYVSEIIYGVGKSLDERAIDDIAEILQNAGPEGMSRSDIMRAFKFDHKRAELLFTTMVQRRLIHQVQYNGQPKYMWNG